MPNVPNASEVRSVIIHGGRDRRHVLQYTRLTLTDAQWMQTMDGRHLLRPVDTDHVQRSIVESLAQGDTVTTFAD